MLMLWRKLSPRLWQYYDKMDKQKILMNSAVALLIFIPIWFILFIPGLKSLPDNFNYKATIFSTDNFYDAEKRDFGGEFASNTRFSYEVVDVKNGILIVKNTFEVRKFTGEKIFSVERSYGIIKKTGQHVKGFGDRDREGYLFAPKKLKRGEGFTYWHINYDEPAHMEFKDVEKIEGLEVYRYETNYHADQTSDLEHLPGVPEERGINLDINLQLWIEPVTGRMIKYEDKTIAYYYDTKTEERIHPWNKFNNKFNPLSVKNQVEIAKGIKFKISLVEKIIPVLIGLIAILLLIIRYMKFSKKEKR